MAPLNKAQKTLATCCGVHIIHDGLSDILFVLLPVLQKSFGLSFVEIGFIRGAHRSALVLFQLPVGLLSERLGVIRTIIVTELITAVGIFILIFIERNFTFIILPFLGVALNGTSSVLQGTVGDLVDGKRQSRAFGLFYTMSAACGVTAPLVFGYLADYSGIRTTMIVISGLVLLTLPFCFILHSVLQAVERSSE